jgi:peptide/nickel transport system substrate-binding protein
LQTLDPIKSAELVQYNLDLQIYECLVGVGPDGHIVPALAAKWDVSPDGKTWTFHLRDARFSDDECFVGGRGRPVVADDILYSWMRGLDPKTGSLNSWALSTCVVGASTFSKGETREIAGLRKLDDRTVQVSLVEPDRDFLTKLTVLSTAVVPKEAIDRYGQAFGAHPVGTGPFVFRSWQPGEYLILVRNPTYGVGSGWQPMVAKVDSVRFRFFRSDVQIAEAFDHGELDVRTITGSDIARTGGTRSVEQLQVGLPNGVVQRVGEVCSIHLIAPMIGADYAFGSSADLRRELADTFNHERLLESAIGPLGNITKTLALPKRVLIDGFSPGSPPPAGLKGSLRGRTVRVAYVSSRIDDITVDLLKQWIEQQGGSVRLFPSVSINALFASIGEVKPDLTLIYWSPYFPNVANYLTALLSSSRPVPNFTGFTNSELDQAAERLKTAEGEQGEAVRTAIKKILDAEMPWIPVYYETPLFLVRPNVQNFKISPVSVMLLTGVEIAPRDQIQKDRS